MRRHGWGGDVPTDDDEARARILVAARSALDDRPTQAPSISDVAERLSVTRQTVYRYFPSAEALLITTVEDGTQAFLDDIEAHLRPLRTPADAVVEGIVYTYEQIHERPNLALVLASGGLVHEVTSATGRALGRSILERLPIDWGSEGDADWLDEVVEVMLRTLQSFLVDPGDPPASPDQLRRYLTRWVAPAITVRDAGVVAAPH